MTRAVLVLADGTVFEGRALGLAGETAGEVVFNTAMTGYQEILTDPSYTGQMVVMTCPHIGNYGLSRDDAESRRVWADGFIVTEACRRPSNWRSDLALHDYLTGHRVVSIEGIDTRYLTRHLRDHGSQTGVISHVDFDHDRLVEKARAWPAMIGRDLVGTVTCREPYEWTEGTGTWSQSLTTRRYAASDPTTPFRVVVYDYGVKQNILRRLVDEGCAVTVVPASTTAQTIRTMNPDGILLSNGPGDPQGPSYLVPHIRDLLGWRPIMGICLGHQMLSLALGLSTYKLKFGHHGANHPVMDVRSGKVEIASHNHNFAVNMTVGEQADSRVQTPWGPFEATHVSLNDGCLEGLAGVSASVLSVQYHPEASPGPHDSSYLFGQFRCMMEDHHA